MEVEGEERRGKREEKGSREDSDIISPTRGRSRDNEKERKGEAGNQTNHEVMLKEEQAGINKTID